MTYRRPRLDGDTLRKSFRDFIKKAESLGAGYGRDGLSGGLRAAIGRRELFRAGRFRDQSRHRFPIEALRIGDYVRQLASLPLKAGIVVLDAARQQPFVKAQIASGLALVEADPHMLIAFNAAPGTVAPAEQGPTAPTPSRWPR